MEERGGRDRTGRREALFQPLLPIHLTGRRWAGPVRPGEVGGWEELFCISLMWCFKCQAYYFPIPTQEVMGGRLFVADDLIYLPTYHSDRHSTTGVACLFIVPACLPTSGP